MACAHCNPPAHVSRGFRGALGQFRITKGGVTIMNVPLISSRPTKTATATKSPKRSPSASKSTPALLKVSHVGFACSSRLVICPLDDRGLGWRHGDRLSSPVAAAATTIIMAPSCVVVCPWVSRSMRTLCVNVGARGPTVTSGLLPSFCLSHVVRLCPFCRARARARRARRRERRPLPLQSELCAVMSM